jgi:hypothetical protein
MPRIVACGGRLRAFESFRTSHENAGDEIFPILLVDSEAPVIGRNSWEHVMLRHGDGWQRPPGTSDDQIHLMVQAMEAWFHADKITLQQYYGQQFRVNVLSQRPDVENISKADLFDGLGRATQDCQKGPYSKGEDSFKILSQIDPTRVRMASSVHAERFLQVMDRICAPL